MPDDQRPFVEAAQFLNDVNAQVDELIARASCARSVRKLRRPI